ncbi:MAG TPA: hypothetical protein VJI46_05705 [Candidatus Nanoarchaeia archaeon]|nr:hypothetical protein [Candidatus Nanoarchaeia archaeon]
MSLIDVGSYQRSLSKPVFLNRTDWSKNPSTPGEVWLDNALKKGDTLHDSVLWNLTQHPYYRAIDVFGFGEGYERSDFVAGRYTKPYAWVEGWLAGNPILQYAEPHKDIGVIESIGGVPFEHDNWFGHKTDLEVHCSPRSVGKFLTMAETTRRYLINFLNTEEGQALAQHLEKQGYHNPAKITKVAGGYLSGGTLAGVNPTKGILMANPKLYDMAHALAREKGMSVEDAIKYVMAHEITHLYAKGVKDTVSLEEEVDTVLQNFYKSRAEGRFKGYSIGVQGSEKKNGDKIRQKYTEERLKKIADIYYRKGKHLDEETLEELVEKLEEELEEMKEDASDSEEAQEAEEMTEETQEAAEESS